MSLFAAEPPPTPPWEAQALVDHPLVGKIWSVAWRRYLSPDEAVRVLSKGAFILLGEKHDNPDHHKLQAWVLNRLLEDGRKLGVGFEMMDRDKAPVLAAYREAHPKDAAGLGAALDWATTGWPEWGQYQPLAQAALERGLPLIPANLPRATVKAMGKEGISALPPGEAARLGLDRPLSPEHEAALAEEIRQAHCGHLPETVVPRMIDVQRAKDAAMALALTEESPEGGVLITGSVHARADRGVPFHLAGRKVTTAAFLEVNARWSKPDDYAAGFGAAELPFDVVWFTPRVDEADPCEKYAEQLKALRDKGIGNGMKTP